VETQTKWQDLVTEFVESEYFELNNLPPIEPVHDTRAKKLLTEKTSNRRSGMETWIPGQLAC